MLADIQSSVCRRLLQIIVILLASQQHRGLKTNILQGSLYIHVSTFLAHWKTISNTVECVDIVWNWPNEPVVAGFSGGSHRIDAALFTWRRLMSYVLWRQRGGPREGEEIHPGTLAVCWGALGEGEDRTNRSTNFGVSTCILARPPRIMRRGSGEERHFRVSKPTSLCSFETVFSDKIWRGRKI